MHLPKGGSPLRTIISWAAVATVLMSYPLQSTAEGKRSSSRSSSSTSKSSSSAPSQQCDRDGDGAQSAEPSCGGRDCNDSDPEINPNKLETSLTACQDRKDNDCNGSTDCSDPSCAGKPAFIQGVFSLELTGLCCATENGGQPVDPSKDSNNCGGCGIKCQSAKVCVAGKCVGRCESSNTACFREPFPFDVPIKRDLAGHLPSQIQTIVDGLQGDPECQSLKGKEPKFDIKYWSEPLRDHRGNLTGESVRGLCVTASF